MSSIANEAAFFRFMENNGVSSDAGKSYLSRLRYVVELYEIDLVNLTASQVDKIFQALLRSQNTRERYTTNAAVSDIKSALNKYLAFIKYDVDESNIVNDIASITGVGVTTTKSKIETRLGQGKYRKAIVALWKKCAVTEFDRVDLLIASHIKPWSKSNDAERIDPFNGLLLSPTLDKLFDRGYISFTAEGEILISPLLDESDIKRLGITKTMKLYKVEKGCIPYLEFHRGVVYVQQNY